MLSRRQVLERAGRGALVLGSAGFGAGVLLPRVSWGTGAPVTPGVPAGTTASAVLEALPGKKPLIKLSYRPPNYETPLEYFNQPLTPNRLLKNSKRVHGWATIESRKARH